MTVDLGHVLNPRRCVFYFPLPSSATGVTAPRPTKSQPPQPREFQPWSRTHCSHRPTSHTSSPRPRPPGTRGSRHAPPSAAPPVRGPASARCPDLLASGLHTRGSGKTSCSRSGKAPLRPACASGTGQAVPPDASCTWDRAHTHMTCHQPQPLEEKPASPRVSPGRCCGQNLSLSRRKEHVRG